LKAASVDACEAVSKDYQRLGAPRTIYHSNLPSVVYRCDLVLETFTRALTHDNNTHAAIFGGCQILDRRAKLSGPARRHDGCRATILDDIGRQIALLRFFGLGSELPNSFCPAEFHSAFEKSRDDCAFPRTGGCNRARHARRAAKRDYTAVWVLKCFSCGLGKRVGAHVRLTA
jgi:hypothetical protein